MWELFIYNHLSDPCPLLGKYKELLFCYSNEYVNIIGRDKTHSLLSMITISGYVSVFAISHGTPNSSKSIFGSAVITVLAEKLTLLPIRFDLTRPVLPFILSDIDLIGLFDLWPPILLPLPSEISNLKSDVDDIFNIDSVDMLAKKEISNITFRMFRICV